MKWSKTEDAYVIQITSLYEFPFRRHFRRKYKIKMIAWFNGNIYDSLFIECVEILGLIVYVTVA